MKTILAFSLANIFASGIAFSANAETGSEAAETKPVKSIVPGKYAGKYKNGGSDPVAEFIKERTYDKGEIVPESFFALCRANGLNEEKIAGFEAAVAAKTQGAAGRARMTLGNTLRAMARKNGSLKDLNGNDVAIEGLEKPALSGAAAKAQETAQTATSTEADPDGDEDDTVEDEDEDETTE